MKDLLNIIGCPDSRLNIVFKRGRLDFGEQNTLSMILMNQHLGQTYSIIPLKMGANSKTLFFPETGVVRKMAPLRYYPKLKSQYDWLLEERGGPYPEVLNQGWEDGQYFYDMPYYSHISFFDYIHKNDTKNNWILLNSILEFLDNSLYFQLEKKTSPPIFKKYVEEKAVGKIRQIIEISPQFRPLIENPKIIINEKEYLNFFTILEKIMASTKAEKELSFFSFGKIHGDLTVENILIKNDQYIILDPNNENLLSSPLLDYSKMYQSLHSGYENLCNLKYVNVRKNQIIFDNLVSNQYKELFQSFNKYLQMKLSTGDQRSLIFHEAIHFCRLLPYRVKLFPATWTAFYSQAIKLFNQYFEMIK